MEDLTGKQFGSYQIISQFGQGGMATVYKAYQPSMDRFVAIKVLPRFHSSDPEFLGRFEQEAKALAQLQHPHILPVFDFGESEGYTYFVMPLMQDGNLAELLTHTRFPLESIKQVISQIGGALDFAHSQGFLHRDVKPSNVLLDKSGNCLLMDFGVAKIIEGSKEFTRTGGILGTPAYMSPEQGSGKKIDHKSDIYSLGIILYELVTGRPPFEAETPVAVIFKHVHDPLPPPSSIIPDIPEEVEKVILKSLAKNPDHRFKTVREMIDTLSKAVNESLRLEPTVVEIPPIQVDIDSAPVEASPDATTPDTELDEPPVILPTPQLFHDRKEKIITSKIALPTRSMLVGVGAIVVVTALILIGINLNRQDQGEVPPQEPTATRAAVLEPTIAPTEEVEVTDTPDPSQRDVSIAPTLVPVELTPTVVTFSPIFQVEDIPCYKFDYSGVDVWSAWLQSAVTFDGRISSQQEWSDATCLDLTLGTPDYSSDGEWTTTINSKWWIKNDADWVYFLAVVHVSEVDNPGASASYFWPFPDDWESDWVWEHSDSSSITINSNLRDRQGWDHNRWYPDTDVQGGENNVVGMAAQGGEYFWFEFGKPLDSGDVYDWSWEPGEFISEDGNFILAIWDVAVPTWYEVYLNLRLAGG